jgi:histidinol phosphatase-like enzyme (inositol monophosphatase family)
MTDQLSTDMLAFATDVVTQAGRVALAYFQTELTIDSKADDSPVTVADREAERLMRELIRARFPHDEIAGEEMGVDAVDSISTSTGRRWVLDPIDGTRSFIRGVPLFGVMIALQVDDVVQLGVLHFPALSETVAAMRGGGCWWNGKRAQVSNVSSIEQALILTTDATNFSTLFERARSEAFSPGSAKFPMIRTWGDCYGYALVATGRAEAMFDPALAVWDVAALIPIIEEAGGVITSMSGAPPLPVNGAIATNRVIADALRTMIGTSK